MSKYINKFKENMPEMGHFARKYLREILTILAVVAAGFSSWKGIFINNLGMTLIFTMIGLIVGILIPSKIDHWSYQFYKLTTRKSQIAEIAIECSKIIIAFFFAFAYFCWMGLLASSAYHYFSHQARTHNNHDKAA